MSYFTMQTDNLRSVLTKKQSRIFFLPLWSIRPHKPYQNLRPRDSRNPLTGENEIRPINEIASSHLARRTFVGNAYFKVSDPNLIGKMSGHVDGSKAFKRYRKIEDETLKNVIDMIG